MKIIAALIAATVAMFLLSTGTAKADCYVSCNDNGASYTCSTVC